MSKTLNDSQKIKIGEYTVEAKRLPLGKMAELIRSIDNLDFLNNIEADTTNSQLMAQLPKLVSDFLPSFAKLTATAINSEKIDYQYILNNAYLDQILNFVAEFIRVNRLTQILGGAKKIGALLGRNKEPVQAKQ